MVLSAAVNSLMVCGAQCGPSSMLWSIIIIMVSRCDKHCLSASGAEVAEPAQCTTELARRRGLQGHRGQPWGHQPWPGGGWRRPLPACGRRASFLNIHVTILYTQAQPARGGVHGPPSMVFLYLQSGMQNCANVLGLFFVSKLGSPESDGTHRTVHSTCTHWSLPVWWYSVPSF